MAGSSFPIKSISGVHPLDGMSDILLLYPAGGRSVNAEGRRFLPSAGRNRFPLRRNGDFAIMQGATGRCGRQGRAGMFKRMYLEITNVCNLRAPSAPAPSGPRRFMTPEEFRQLATRLRPYGTYLMLHVMGSRCCIPNWRSCWYRRGAGLSGCAL